MKCWNVFRLFLIAVVVFFSVSSNAQTYDWVKGMRGSTPRAVCTDASENSYITGHFNGGASFGDTTIYGAGSEDVFVAKYDDTGNCVWVKSAGGGTDDIGYGISIDALGNSYIVGSFSGVATFGTIQLNIYGGNADIFIAKYDNFGNCVWAKNAGGVSYDQGKGICTDSEGNSYITGLFSGNATFDTTVLSSLGPGNVFVAKYNNAGNCIWAKQGVGTSSDGQIGHGISIDANGNSYVTGYFLGTARFGNITLASYGGEDIFVVKYDDSGNFKWVRQSGGSATDISYGISTDAAGNCLVTGCFFETATFGTTSLTSLGAQDIFLVKYDSLGNCVYVKKAGGTNSDVAYSVAIDATGEGYLTGLFYGTASFGATSLTSYGQCDLFTAKYDSVGNCVWAKQAGGLSLDKGFGVSVSGNGSVYFTGTNAPDADFGGGFSISLDGGFLVKTVSTTLIDDVLGQPAGFELLQNYPNPFNPSTTINYELSITNYVSLKVFDMIGNEVATLVNEMQSSGTYNVTFDARKLSSGVYLYQLRAGDFVSSKKLILMK